MSGVPIEIDLTGALRTRGSFSSWDGTELVVRAPCAAPPGARLDAVIAREDGGGLPFKMKAIRCRKVEDGRFEITLRVLELSRGAREELEAVARGALPSSTVEAVEKTEMAQPVGDDPKES
jgi:hypothetical protein